MERYKKQIGVYPERGLADKIYRTRENIAWCKERGIRLNGPRLWVARPRTRRCTGNSWMKSEGNQGNATRLRGTSGYVSVNTGLAWY